jgi:hypothetical protein
VLLLPLSCQHHLLLSPLKLFLFPLPLQHLLLSEPLLLHLDLLFFHSPLPFLVLLQ